MRSAATIFLFITAQAACATALGLLGGCQATGPLELITGHDAGPSDGATFGDGGTTDAAEDAPSQPDAGDGPSPVFVGITPNPPSSGSEEPTAADKFAARLTTLAAGVRSAVISRSWRDLTQDQYDKLATEIAFYEKYNKKVLLNVAFVDRLEDGRPVDLLNLSWDDELVKTSIAATMDEVLQKFGKSLPIITFGRDVDIYIDAHPSERGAVEAFVEHACAVTRGHPAGQPGLRVAAATSFQGAVKASPSFTALLSMSDVAALSYLPGFGEESVAPSSGVAGDLDALIMVSAGKPIVLQAIGYPSDMAVGSSPEKQRLFYETFFDALSPRRSAFELVNVFELHDLGTPACEAFASAQGELTFGPISAYGCSLGLFTAAGEKKPAWTEVLFGVATFASP